jgi:hypothetical protein
MPAFPTIVDTVAKWADWQQQEVQYTSAHEYDIVPLGKLRMRPDSTIACRLGITLRDQVMRKQRRFTSCSAKTRKTFSRMAGHVFHLFELARNAFYTAAHA